MARTLLIPLWMAVTATTRRAIPHPALGAIGMLSAGCVVPAPLEIAGADGGANSPPVIVSADSPFAFPGPITLARSEQQRLVLTVSDVDLEDTLYVRLYVDYGITGVTPATVTCTIPPSKSQLRVKDCSLASVCTNVGETDTSNHFLEAMIADQQFLEEGEPFFRALPETAGRSYRAWLMNCDRVSE